MLGFWPDNRIFTTLVRLPKEGGGSRLIALVQTLLRVWAKARSFISRQWVAQTDLRDVWGAGG
eukprot:2036965-Pyramimonas_sp.AAC.1